MQPNVRILCLAALLAAGAVCDRPTDPLPAGPAAPVVEPAPPASLPAQVAPPVPKLAPLVPFPVGLSARARVLAGRLDANLRYPGAVANRVAKFLRYNADCKSVVTRYRALIDEVTPELLERRASVQRTRSQLDQISGPDRLAFWRWLDNVRVLLEDELSPQSFALEEAATAFRRRCPKQAPTMAKLSRVVDKIHIRTRIDLHRLFKAPGATTVASKAPTGPGARSAPARPLVPLPRGITAESRLRCQQFSAGLRVFLAAIRTTRDVFSSSDCAAVLPGLDQLDQQLPWLRAREREFGRHYVELILVAAKDQAQVRRWHRRAGRRVERQLKRTLKSMLRSVFRFRRRCPTQFKLVTQRGHRFGQRKMGMGTPVEKVLTRPRRHGPWRYEWRWETE